MFGQLTKAPLQERLARLTRGCYPPSVLRRFGQGCVSPTWFNSEASSFSGAFTRGEIGHISTVLLMREPPFLVVPLNQRSPKRTGSMRSAKGRARGRRSRIACTHAPLPLRDSIAVSATMTRSRACSAGIRSSRLRINVNRRHDVFRVLVVQLLPREPERVAPQLSWFRDLAGLKVFRRYPPRCAEELLLLGTRNAARA